MNESSPKQTILIVDDAPENITILGEMLRAEFTIRVATGGEKALKIALSDQPPDLILLDVMMPGMDGYEVCRILKADPRAQGIPVIFITAKNSELDEIKGFEMGAVDYITKPFSPVVVCARVRTHAELKKYRDDLQKASYSDGLTGVANRRHFDEYLATAWNFARRQATPLSLIMIDIDHFKAFNDNYGHQAGDACLIRVARALAESVKRRTDLVARFGGEEFVCVLPGTAISGALQMAEEFRANVLALQIPHAYSSAASWVTISQGIAALIPAPDAAPACLVKAADEALYKSKQNGRNRISQ